MFWVHVMPVLPAPMATCAYFAIALICRTAGHADLIRRLWWPSAPVVRGSVSDINDASIASSPSNNRNASLYDVRPEATDTDKAHAPA